MVLRNRALQKKDWKPAGSRSLQNVQTPTNQHQDAVIDFRVLSKGKVLGYKNIQGVHVCHCALVIQRSANKTWSSESFRRVNLDRSLDLWEKKGTRSISSRLKGPSFSTEQIEAL
jgi:hypothetical protein